MLKSTLKFFYLGLVFLCSCNTVSDQALQGDWLVTKIIYKNKNIIPSSSTVEVSLVPVGYEAIGEVHFLASNRSHFPGIATHDLPVRWRIEKGNLLITADSAAIETEILEEISTLRLESRFSSNQKLKETYKLKRDSLLKIRGLQSFKAPIEIYSGVYKIQETIDGFLLNSADTKIELVNKDKAFRKAISGIMP